MLAGILLLICHPFRVGDEQRVIMVNSVIYTGTVTVRAYGLLRSGNDVGVVYGGDASMVRSIALEAVKGVDGVLADPAPDVLLWDLAGSFNPLRVRWWMRPKRSGVVQVRDRVFQAVAEVLASPALTSCSRRRRCCCTIRPRRATGSAVASTRAGRRVTACRRRDR